MSHPPPRAVIFDIGRVIVRVDLNRALATLGTQSQLSPEQIWESVQADPRWTDWQEGRMTPREWRRHLTDLLHSRVPYERFCTLWNAALDPEPILGEEFFAELGKRCRLLLLSNTDPIHLSHMEATYTFPRHFPIQIYSCRVSQSKPSRGIYQFAIQQAGVAPREILYIDDVDQYVHAGKAAGMRVHLFRDTEGLVDKLRDFDLL